MRRFKCGSCGYEWDEPYGTGRPAKCPKCGSTTIYRIDNERGFGRGRRGRGFGQGRGAGRGQGSGSGRGQGRGRWL